MKLRLLSLFDRMKASYWLAPSIMAVGAVLLSVLTLYIDRVMDGDLKSEVTWIYSGGPQGARQVLSTIAGSIITVAGTTFSITIAALSLASAQFGPRLLRNFMSDRGNQIVLGTFTSTFLYCLLILRTIRGDDYSLFVPHISVTTGVVLALFSLGVLIYFIHHVAQSIQVSHVISAVGHEMDSTLRKLFPEKIGQASGEVRLPPGSPEPVRSESTGYVQALDADSLLEAAVDEGLVIRVLVQPGDYVIEGQAVAEVWPSARDSDAARIRSCFAYGNQRTPAQDAEFAILQLAELGVRALSPGINDPFTANMCVDRITAGLHLLADRHLPSPLRHDEEGRLVVIAEPFQYKRLVLAGYRLIRQNAREHPIVLERILIQLEGLLENIQELEFRQAIEAEIGLTKLNMTGVGE